MNVGEVILINVGRKRRPAVVANVKGGLVVVIPVTSTKSEVSIGFYKTILLGEGYFTKQILTVPLEVAEASKIGFFHDTEYLTNIFKEIKEWLT